MFAETKPHQVSQVGSPTEETKQRLTIPKDQTRKDSGRPTNPTNTGQNYVKKTRQTQISQYRQADQNQRGDATRSQSQGWKKQTVTNQQGPKELGMPHSHSKAPWPNLDSRPGGRDTKPTKKDRPAATKGARLSTFQQQRFTANLR